MEMLKQKRACNVNARKCQGQWPLEQNKSLLCGNVSQPDDAASSQTVSFTPVSCSLPPVGFLASACLAAAQLTFASAQTHHTGSNHHSPAQCASASE
eukprot:scaffold191556_cov16-Tisochrysis_lutea.AAC.1